MTNTVQINLKEHFYDKTTLDRDFAKKSDIPTLSNLGGVVNVIKQQEAETGYASTYYITQDGTQVGSKINIPKDFLVRSASIKTVTTADEPQQGFQVDDKYLDFVINVADDSATNTHVYVNVKDLFNEYQAGTGLTLSNNTFSITPGTIPTDVSDLTDTEDTEFTPKSHKHGNITDDGKLSSPSQVVMTGADSKITSVSALDCLYVRDTMASEYDNISSSLTSTSKQRDINGAINTKIGDINTAIDTINNAGYITASEADLDNYYTKTQVDEMNCGTFAELRKLINTASGNFISLDKDYKNDGSESEININRSITIIGNGHVIDGNNTSRIFNITSNKLVKCVGIYFINGNTTGNGGAIRCDTDCSFFDCKFYNNTGQMGGGLYCTSNNIIVNCLFYGNQGGHGGGIHNAFSNTIISNCMFLYNSASGSGGGLVTDINNTIIECIFKNNTSSYGNAINSSTNGLIVYNCYVNTTDLRNTINKNYLTDHQDISNKLEFSDLDDMIGLSYDNSTGILSLTFTDPNNNS